MNKIKRNSVLVLNLKDIASLQKSVSCILAPVIFMILTLFSASTFAVPIQWKTTDGGNGNWYDLIFKNKSWTDAKNSSESLFLNGSQGHLATVTSTEENTFLVNTFLSGQNRKGFWLGGYQLPGQTATDEGWQWVTDEAWNYTNWWLGNVVAEPNDWPGMGVEDGQENFMGYSHESFGQWNDTKDNEPWMSFGYFVEYEENISVPEPSIFLLFLSGFGLLVMHSRRNSVA